MSTLLDDLLTRQTTVPAARLRTTMAAVRVSIQWFGIRRSLTAEQKAAAAEPFNAEARFLSAGKKLLDNAAPSFKAVTTVVAARPSPIGRCPCLIPSRGAPHSPG